MPLEAPVINMFEGVLGDFTITVPIDVTQLTLRARATDLAGNIGVTEDLVLNVVEDTPPVVTFVQPEAAKGYKAFFSFSKEISVYCSELLPLRPHPE